MKLDITNGNLINSKDIDIHDWIFKEIGFNYKEKKMCVCLQNPQSNIKEEIIEFVNVIGFNMTSSDFWGKSPHVLDWEYVEKDEQVLINGLFEKKNFHQYMYSSLNDDINYIESNITLSSGDLLMVACEYILFGKD